MEELRTMLQLDLEEAQTGMVIGQEVRGANGQVLLGVGTTLTDTHLEVLRAHRVQHIVIKASRPAPTRRLDPSAMDAQLDNKFRFCDEQQPLIHELRRLCGSRLSQDREGIE